MSQKALITGAAGFIGSHLCEALIREGWHVTGVDCFIDNYSINIKEANVAGLITDPNFVLIREDISKVHLEAYLEGVDLVFHLAGQPGVRRSWGRNFDSYVANNILATQRILEAVKNSSIKKVIFASSSSIYGNTGMRPMNEADLPKPFSPYGLTKLAAENLCQLYHENYGVPVISLRYFTVFGPRQRPDMAISFFINSLLSGSPITVFGDGKQKRDFTYVDDIIKANILAARSSIEGEVFNVGNGNPVELIEVIRMLERKTGRKAQLEFISRQEGDVMDTYADNNKIKQRLGYEPSIDLEEGLAKQVEMVQS